jgi:putative effector of murein hydrolase
VLDSGENLWLGLSPSPLLWLAITLLAYHIGERIKAWCKDAAWASPVLIAIVIISVLLLVSHTNYKTYFTGAQFIHFLLGPVTVALGVPLAENIGHVRRSLGSMIPALAIGSATSIVSGYFITLACGGSLPIALSMAPKAVTTPIAMALAQEIGGVPALTAVLAILAGILAAVAGEPLLRFLGVKDWRAHGLAAGIAGSGVAAAQVAGRDPLAAAFSALGIGLNGLVTAIAVPIFVALA